MEKDWEKEAVKWENEIKPMEVSKDELTDYLWYKMYVYTEIYN